MKKLLFLSIIGNIAAICYIFTILQSNPSHTISKEKSKLVAIISPAIHPSLEKIELGVIQSLEQTLPGVQTRVMNANGKKTLMLAQIQEALNTNPDAIVTLGAQATQLTRELIKKRKSNVPQVFTAVSSPEKLGLMHHPKELTGLEEKSDYTITSDILNHLAPTIRSILLVYNPTEGNALEHERAELENSLAKYGIKLTGLEVYQTSEIIQKTRSFIADHDAVVVLKDNTVVSGLDSLVKLCDQHSKLLITHDLDSADRGAGLSFGVFEEAYGHGAGKIVGKALKTQQFTLPEIQRIAGNHVKINVKAAQKQGLAIAPAEIKLLRAALIVD